MQKLFQVLSLVGVSLLSLNVSSNEVLSAEYHKINRYTSVSLSPEEEKKDLLSQVVDVNIPKQIINLGDGAKYLLQGSGYRLDEGSDSENSFFYFYTLPFPDAHRNIKRTRLKDALTILGQDSFQLVIDPVRRKVTYTLKNNFQGKLTRLEIDAAKQVWDEINKKSMEYTVTYQYGPVQSGETLLSIANLLEIKGASKEQIMMAVYDANRAAFYQSNINYLSTGVILDIPDELTIRKLSYPVAKSRMRDHFYQWMKNNDENNHDQ